MRRQTKIVATMGPAVASLGQVAELIHAGLDVARLNFSHGGHDTHRQFADWVREAANEAGANVALLQDIQGPKLRLGNLPDGMVRLDRGEQVDLVPGAQSTDPSHIPVDYEHLLEDVAPGGSVLVADGLVRLEVAERMHDRLRCVVVAGGELADHKGVAFPGSALRVPPLTDKDAADIAFGRELGVDYVAMSFVRSSEDIRQVAALVEPGTPIIAKVELAAAYENLDDIMAAADGVMVARGDLGVELPLERIPLVQADILERANAAGLLTITATEMLQSMVEAPRPTRAEVTDVATAVTEGTDAVMLSGETAVGKYPVEAVRMMDTICREVETGLRPQRRSAHLTLSSVPTFASAIAKAAVEAAVDLDLSTIVAFTETGSTARLLSKYRPASDIVAFTAREATLRRMALYWGVRAVPFERRAYTDLEIAAAEKYLEKERLCTRGEGVVMVAGIPANRQASTNLMKLHVIGDRDRGVPSQRDGRSAGGLSGPV
jgi:pyruvate kinase